MDGEVENEWADLNVNRPNQNYCKPALSNGAQSNSIFDVNIKSWTVLIYIYESMTLLTFIVYYKSSSSPDTNSYQDIGDLNESVCSRSAVVTATSSSREKSTAVITAEDEGSIKLHFKL